jgi:eukaryotic-like serine/threonine-protein kinase
MAADPHRLIGLAEAVADGQAVDWLSAESTAESRAEQELIAELRLLAGVADVHRQALLDDEAVADASETREIGWTWRGLEVQELIGIGSFGNVYRARDQHLGRDVALKLLRRDSPSQAAPAIVEEGRLLARVRHPHVITVYGADRHDGRVGIWMEFVKGRTLEDLLAANGPLGAREAALMGEELCSALAAVHAVGLVHRDVKAHNVMRESGGRVVLMDFGAGQDANSVGLADSRATGTPLYMAPELFEGAPATPASDLYSLGVLLFRLVSGAYPVNGRTAADVQVAHREGRRRQLRDFRPDLPAPFIGVIERALSSTPADRYETAGSMESALASASRSSPWRVSRAFKTRFLVAAGVLAAVVLGVWGAMVGISVWPSPVRTIAVLPLQNLTGDTESDYLVSGVGELLLSRLNSIAGLRIIPPSSTQVMAGDPHRTTRASEQLGADYVLEGSVAQSTTRLRVSMRLVTAGTGVVQWGNTYERQITDLFTVEMEVAAAVAHAVNVNIRDERLQVRYTTSAEAQEAYFRGRYLLYRFDRTVLSEVRRLFEDAVRIDPQFALAQASLARAYLMIAAYDLAPLSEVGPLATAAARQAADLAPDLSEARVALAEVAFKAQRDWVGAEEEYRKALQLAPNASVVLSPFSRFLAAAGRPEEALAKARVGLMADPLSAEMMASVAINEYYLRRFEDAVRTFDKVTAAHPRYGPGFLGRARARSARGDNEAAVLDIKEALTLSGGEPSYLAELARVHAAAGWRNTAEQLLGELLDLSRNGQKLVAPQDLAWVYAALGDHDRALSLLDEALETNHARVLFIRVDPRADPLRQDPRFYQLLERLGTVRR